MKLLHNINVFISILQKVNNHFSKQTEGKL